MKTLVLGLGNPILSDDGVGIRVAEELQRRLDHQDVTVMETSLCSLSLLDILSGYDRAIVIDAIETAEGHPGQIYRLLPDMITPTRNASNPHDVGFAHALELGRRLSIDLPQEIIIYAVEIEDVITFSEECTPRVREAIPLCVERILQELGGGRNA